MRSNWNRWIFAGCALWIAAGVCREAGAATVPVLQSRDFDRAAATVPAGSRLRLAGVQVADGDPVTLSLERFDVFTRDARITVHGAAGDEVLPAPANAYFRGVVEGRSGSRVFLAKLAAGGAEGIVNDGGEVYLIGGDDAPVKAANTPLEMRRIEPALLKSGRKDGFTCGQSTLPQTQGVGGGQAGLDLTELAGSLSLPEKAVATHAARVAIESDFEFYQLFNNTTLATNYVGNLIGYASTIYTSELGTSLLVPSVSLWTTSSDPWTQTNTTCGLMEFGYYWNKNKTGVSRTIAHFLSGKGLGGGIAWLGVLGSGAFNAGASCPGLATDAPWGGGYGFTANISGTFNAASPSVVWDLLATAHEIGHNFNSPHSHCYNGMGGNASPIDQCYSGDCKQTDALGNCINFCYQGTTSLPGPSGAGTGTIMSYCHLRSGGISNVSMTFGSNLGYGVQPSREAAQMFSYILSVAASNPGSLVLPSGLVIDGFESGTLPGAWTGKTP